MYGGVLVHCMDPVHRSQPSPTVEGAALGIGPGAARDQLRQDAQRRGVRQTAVRVTALGCRGLRSIRTSFSNSDFNLRGDRLYEHPPRSSQTPDDRSENSPALEGATIGPIFWGSL